MDGFLVALTLSFGVVFVAELGDKSQLMALAFATRYRAVPVLVGITVATALVHAVSVALGYGLGAVLPTGWIAVAAAVAFVGFGVWTLRGDRLTEEEATKPDRARGSAIVATSVAFCLAELGDKTMLATVALATQHQWFGTWLGSTLGMVAADALAIVVGRLLGRHLPERVVSVGAAALFFLFGAWLLLDALGELTGRGFGELVTSGHPAVGWLASLLALGLLAGAAVGVARRRRARRQVETAAGGARESATRHTTR